MSFSLPTFNLTVNYWNVGHTPATDIPDGSVQGQLYFPPRGLFDVTPADNADWVPPIYLRVSVADKEVFIASSVHIVGMIFGWLDSGGHSWYYLARWWEEAHAGFGNEYCSIVVEQCDNFGISPDSLR